MKTPVKNCRPKTPRKRSKKIQSFLQQPTSFHNHELIETPQCYRFQQKFMLLQTLTSLISLKSEQKLNEQTKTCANKLCKNFFTNNEQEKIDITYENLCQSCQLQFKNQSYCLHCKQVYFDNTDDGKQWIMCEVCQKWVHTSCAQLTIKQSLNISFKCVKCKKVQSQPNTRKYPVRCPVQKVQKKKTLQFLNTIGFQWQLNAKEIQTDMELMKKYSN